MTTESSYIHPDFTTPNFGAVDFGSAAIGPYSGGYKMIAFEPGKILQAQELNEIQFRMSVHTTLTAKMISAWTNVLINSTLSSPDSTGPGWEGATPLYPDSIRYSRTSQQLRIPPGDSWFLCKLNSNGLYFWIPVTTYEIISVNTASFPIGTFFGVELNSTGSGEYTGELVDCEDTGDIGNHPLEVKNTSNCGSSRYFVKIINFKESDVPVTNNFCAFGQKRSDGIYYLNNVKIQEV